MLLVPAAVAKFQLKTQNVIEGKAVKHKNMVPKAGLAC
jgi:hypothetical protein